MTAPPVTSLWVTVLCVTVLLATVGVGLGLPAWTAADEASRYPVAADYLAAARAALATLAVKGRAPTAGYDRTAFGQAWPDVDRNGCDTRFPAGFEGVLHGG
jgi:hypothetical protein